VRADRSPVLFAVVVYVAYNEDEQSEEPSSDARDSGEETEQNPDHETSGNNDLT
jgi:hypothetical protein